MREILKKYQEVDGQMKKIVDEINRSDEGKKSSQLGTFLKEAEESLKKMEIRAKELVAACAKAQDKFKECSSPVADLESGVEHAIDSGELNYVSKKLAEAAKNVSNSEREALALHKELEEILAKFEQLLTKVPIAQKQQREARAAVDNMKMEKKDIMVELQKQRAELEKQLDATVLEIYQRLRSQKVFPACAPLEVNRCSGCRMDIPSGVVAKLNTEPYIICENCGRIVVK